MGEGKLNQIPWLIVIFQEKNMFCLCVWLFFLRYAILLALDTVFHPVLCGERNQESRSKPFKVLWRRRRIYGSSENWLCAVAPLQKDPFTGVVEGIGTSAR